MSKRKPGRKLKETFVSGTTEIGKYKRIVAIEAHPGRPGEEYFVVVDEDGKRTTLGADERRRLEALLEG